MSDTFAQNPKLVELTNANNMTVTIMDWGATIHSIKVPVNGQLQEMLIGPKNPEDYSRQLCYMGATIGRYANRIDKGQFTANGGKSYTVGGGKDVVLHGGEVGFDKLRFTIAAQSKNSVTFTLHSPDGDEGFPGNFDLTVVYTLGDDGALKIEYEGKCDQECAACITNHSYFNLNGRHSSVLGHEGCFNSEQILVIDSRAIPTGVLHDVTARTDKVDNFNFTSWKKFAHSVDDFKDDKNMEFTHGYDHCFVVKGFGDTTKPVISVKGEPIDGKQVQLDVYTDYPAFQFYSGNAINDGAPEGMVAVARDDGKVYGAYDGFAIEPEYFPDAPHLAQFKDINPMVSPSAPLKRFITYKFTVI
ncbi:MAG TPA: galactose mutarotase [Candidatus Anaerobiospirillum stercoravium]|nr:galactose mutarotase [Candidatus Anaerobiospirillum stercoravium]